VVDLFNKLLSAYHQAKIKIEQQQNEIDTLKKNQEGAEQMEEYYKSLLAECKEKGGEVSRPESPYYLKMTWDDDEPCDNDTAEQRQ
jgi:site-specific DNA-adenine methylase